MAAQCIHAALAHLENSQLDSGEPPQRVPRRATQQPRLLVHNDESGQDMPQPEVPYHRRPRESSAKGVVLRQPSVQQTSLHQPTVVWSERLHGVQRCRRAIVVDNRRDDNERWRWKCCRCSQRRRRRGRE